MSQSHELERGTLREPLYPEKQSDQHDERPATDFRPFKLLADCLVPCSPARTGSPPLPRHRAPGVGDAQGFGLQIEADIGRS
jgi:hypothetical protein